MKKEYDFTGAKRGQVIRTPGKTRITIYIDDDILEAFRDRSEDAGRGYQTLINEALRAAMGDDPGPLMSRRFAGSSGKSCPGIGRAPVAGSA